MENTSISLGRISLTLLFLLTPIVALSDESKEPWSAKYGVLPNKMLVPVWPIDLARDYVACGNSENLTPELWETINEISKSHYLDDFSVHRPILERYTNENNLIASMILSEMLSSGTFGALEVAESDAIFDAINLAKPGGFSLSLYDEIKWNKVEKETKEMISSSIKLMENYLRKKPNDTYVTRRLAYYLVIPLDAPRLESKARELLETSLLACPDNVETKFFLGRILSLNPDRVERDYHRGLGLMESTLDSAMGWAPQLVADNDEQLGRYSNVTLLSLYKEGASRGFTLSAYWAGWLLAEAEGIKTDLEEAAMYHKQAAHLGDIDSIAIYAEYLRDGIGVDADPEEALIYFKAAAQNRDSKVLSQYWEGLPRTLEMMGGQQRLERAKAIYEETISLSGKSRAESVVKAIAQAKAGVNRVDRRLTELYANERVTLEQSLENSHRMEEDLEFGNFHALLIGNENYDVLNPLNSASEDAQDLALVLKDRFGFSTEVILDATREEILNKLNDYRYLLSKTDNFLLFYAGHGTYDDEISEGFWQPIDAGNTDANWISNDRITRTLSGFKSQNVIVIADSCYSGVVFRDSSSDKPRPMDKRPEYLRNMLEKKTRVAFTSGGLEPVVDALPGERNSIFMSALISTLKEAEGILTGQEVYLSVSPEVVSNASSMGFEQTPEFSQIRRSGHQGGDFLFVPQKNNK